jgi:hypothetical protein
LCARELILIRALGLKTRQRRLFDRARELVVGSQRVGVGSEEGKIVLPAECVRQVLPNAWVHHQLDNYVEEVGGLRGTLARLMLR